MALGCVSTCEGARAQNWALLTSPNVVHPYFWNVALTFSWLWYFHVQLKYWGKLTSVPVQHIPVCLGSDSLFLHREKGEVLGGWKFLGICRQSGFLLWNLRALLTECSLKSEVHSSKLFDILDFHPFIFPLSCFPCHLLIESKPTLIAGKPLAVGGKRKNK